MMISEKVLVKIMLFPLIFMGGLWSCEEADKDNEVEECFEQSILVTASAYNSLAVQGEGDPSITAWGDTLTPGVRSIAVSRDLLEKGLSYQTPVRIEGLEGIYIVNDKMHPRWKNKIDIYMGIDREKALKWGRKKVVITFPADNEQDGAD
ncbi:3D domain-containing protein [Salinimicrobium flavum]|uniref:3D domain-containing protein n=1 Tax=Salinimicrobium flavum TaxID=1737065 RepID=A0ABW5IY83_9FLAO